MTLHPPTAEALRDAGLAFLPDAPLARRTYWRTGGAADAVIEANTVAQLQRVLEVAHGTGAPVFVLGNGSNLLVSDRGVRGIVLVLGGELAGTKPLDDGPRPAITCGAGLKLTVLLARADRAGWTGLECLAGVPGTVGGAVCMNAGTTLGEVKDCLLHVDVLLRDGTPARLTAKQLNMSYRTTHLPPGAVVTHATFQSTGADVLASRQAIREHLDRRKATQPLDKPSCGSTFRNPPGDHAGRLIEAAGLKGYTVGRAQVSLKHANFIVNLGGATSTELRQVIEHVQRVVHQRFGVQLVREVHFAGDWDEERSKN